MPALVLFMGLALLGAASPVHAQMGMGMDARSMSGIPLQIGDVPDGTVVVRVVRGDLTNVVPGHPVELDVGGTVQTASTDDSGRAEFTALPAGAALRAATTLDGARIESQPFVMPGSGGIRLLLAGGAGAAAGGGAAAASPDAPMRPAVPGAVVLGTQSRVIVEFNDDLLEVFYLMDFVNDTGATLTASAPLVVELPSRAQAVTVLEGSSPQAAVDGRRVVVSGPFAPGATIVQVAFRLPVSGPRLTIAQPFPVPMQQAALMVQKVAGLSLSSAQVPATREMPSEGGRTFITGMGPSLPAGESLVITLDGLPHHATWPRTLALVLACLVLGAGAWAVATARGDSRQAARRDLEGRRERAFQALVALERDARSGRVAAGRYEARRADLVAQLERIYGELDSAGARGDHGQAA